MAADRQVARQVTQFLHVDRGWRKQVEACISGGRCLPRTSLNLEGVFALRDACARLLLRLPSDADWRVRAVIALSNTTGLPFS